MLNMAKGYDRAMRLTIFQNGYLDKGQRKTLKRLTPKQRVEVRERLSGGESPEAIAEGLGVTVDTVSRAAARHDKDGGRVMLTGDDIQAIKGLYLNRAKPEDIADDYGLSATTLKAYLKIWGYMPRSNEDLQRVFSLAAGGMASGAIAAELGLPAEAISEWLKRGRGKGGRGCPVPPFPG